MPYLLIKGGQYPLSSELMEVILQQKMVLKAIKRIWMHSSWILWVIMIERRRTYEELLVFWIMIRENLN